MSSIEHPRSVMDILEKDGLFRILEITTDGKLWATD